MTRLTWDTPGTRLYEAGVDRGVVYAAGKSAAAWNGLVSVKEAPSDTGVTTNYYNGDAFFAQNNPGNFAATIECYTYPDLIDEVKSFNFSYRTKIGNDLVGTDYAYRIHLVFNAKATPSDQQYSTVSDSGDVGSIVLNISTLPVALDATRGGSHLFVDTTQAYSWTVQALEDLIYGTDNQTPSLTNPADILALFDANSILKITNHGDGTWTAEGPDDVVTMLSSTEFQITWPSVVFLTSDEYQVSSL